MARLLNCSIRIFLRDCELEKEMWSQKEFLGKIIVCTPLWQWPVTLREVEQDAYYLLMQLKLKYWIGRDRLNRIC